MVWAPDYATVDELSRFLRIDDAADDAELGLAVSAASRAVDLHTGRQFGNVSPPQPRKYTACWDRFRRRWTVEFDDVQDVTGLAVMVEGGPITVFTLEPVNAAQKGKPYTGLVVDTGSTVAPTSEEHGVTVTALWGWTTVPVPVKEATLLQASRFHARRGSPYGVAGSPELGSELRLLARVDADVAVSLGNFVRWWAAA